MNDFAQPRASRARWSSWLPVIALAAGACERAESAPIASASTTNVAPAAEQSSPAAVATPARERINPRLLRRFRPVASDDSTPTVAPNEDVVDLGRMLWFDARLSKDATISCNSCHDLASYGADGRPRSIGDGGQRGRRNSPTVYNSSEHFAFFWDGRAPTAEAQAAIPILGAVEMASSKKHVEDFLASVPEYRQRFEKAFKTKAPPTLEQVAISLAAFEQGLRTRSRWDDYLDGDEAALSDEEVHGLRVFLDVGCMTCHTGPQVGASSFQRAGAVEAWPNQDDLGRFEVTHDPADRMMFKVPTLKNVARTAPYFHDGSTETLADAVQRMARHQLGITLEANEVAAIVHFLDAMTGALPAAYIAPPKLPELPVDVGG